MSKKIVDGGKYVIYGTKNTATVVTKVGKDVAVSVINHAYGAGRVMVKAGAKIIRMTLGK